MFCPSCGARNRERAKFCTKCGARLLQDQAADSDDASSYPSVFQEYHHLRHQELDKGNVPNIESGAYPLAGPLGGNAVDYVGEDRSVAWALVLTLLTCGIYGFVWLYRIGKDLRSRLGPAGPHAGLDTFLTILTCGLWGVYLAYKYPALIDRIEREAGMAESGLSVACLLLSVFSIWKVYGLGIVSLALMQNELNKIWHTLKRG
jgi:hypothetical protein